MLKIKEAIMSGPIHTIRSGSIKKELSNQDSPTHKAVDMVLDGNFVELTVRKTKEKILVPYTYFSHLVPGE